MRKGYVQGDIDWLRSIIYKTSYFSRDVAVKKGYKKTKGISSLTYIFGLRCGHSFENIIEPVM